MVIGFEEQIPLAIHDEKGTLAGVAVDQWSDIATRLDVEYESVSLHPGEGVEALRQGRVHIVFLADPINVSNESQVDYSTPFF